MIFPKLVLRLERWKFNKDYGVYVSTLGHFKDRHKRNLPYKINQEGYCAVKTECGTVYAHRLVMFTWRPIPNAEKLTVDHKNHNKRDNSIENLEWVSKIENLRRASEDYIITPTNLNNYQFYIGKHQFDTIDDAYNFLKQRKEAKNLQKERLITIFEGLARERTKGNFKGSVKSYFGYNITAIERMK